MKSITFTKYEGLGNDFIIVDESQDKNRLAPSMPLLQRVALCHRDSGIGADGVITILPPLDVASKVFMHLTNSDGSIPENCGNGLRCVAKWLHDTSRISQSEIIYIDTLSGPKKAWVELEKVGVVLGIATVDSPYEYAGIVKTITILATENQVEAPVVCGVVDIGNPHLILESQDPERDRKIFGPSLEKSNEFADGINVSFFRCLGENKIALRVYERGAGITKACGTGAAATVAVLAALGRIVFNKPTFVSFDEGELEMVLQSLANSRFEVTVWGPANKQEDGQWKISE